MAKPFHYDDGREVRLGDQILWSVNGLNGTVVGDFNNNVFLSEHLRSKWSGMKYANGNPLRGFLITEPNAEFIVTSEIDQDIILICRRKINK